ncbi:MAG: glycine--tRNA ligase, partial [Microgenomates group bacterium]
GFWDYGPLGVELKNNIKRQWWKKMVYQREDVVGIDASIIMNPKVWQASGHVESFADPLVECKSCHLRFRADKIENNTCPNCQAKDNFTEPKKFNLLTEVFLGVTEPKEKAYLRGEITQGVFVNFKNIISSSRVKIPFGIAQIGKAFRNEITPGNFTYRSREFEQMELEYFIKPEEKEAEEWFEFWKNERLNWYLNLGIKKENLRFREHEKKEKAHYARKAVDIEYKAPFGWSEFEGIHHRGNWDLSRHNLKYKDSQTNEEFTPWVIETSGGVDRSLLFFLIDSYHEEKGRIILKLHPNLSPVKIAVFPLLANKKDLIETAKKVYQLLKKEFFHVYWDDRGNIGKRYYSQDEIGTPFCVTIDFKTLEDDSVTIRDRDTTKQERIDIDKLIEYFNIKFNS